MSAGGRPPREALTISPESRDACPACGRALRRALLVHDALLHPRAERYGGPFYTVACPRCGARLVAERRSGGYAFRRREDLPRGSRLRRVLDFFLGAPLGRATTTAAAPRPKPRSQDRGPASGATGASRPSGEAAPPISEALRPDLDVLGLDAQPTLPALKRRYRELAKSLHPDAHPNASAAVREKHARRFAEVTAAYRRVLAALARSP